MKKLETYWTIGDKLDLSPGATELEEDQPRIGFELCWNNPRLWWKPFLVLHFWNIHYQLGWLAG